MSGENFVSYHDVSGPARLELEAADTSGKFNSDPMFIADRLAITNHVMAYAHLIDEGRWDDWFALFSDDIVFENTTPELGTVILKGMTAFKALVDDRYIKPGKTSKAVRRHTQGNCHVVGQTCDVIGQTTTTAEVRTYILVSNVPAADRLLTLTTGTYNANLEKRDGRWTITRWCIEVDAPLVPSKMPPINVEDHR